MCKKSGRSEQLEIHDSRPTTSRWHLMMVMSLGAFQTAFISYSIIVTLFGGICCLPSNFAKTELICCPQKTLLFHLGVQISFYLKINILKVMVHLTQLHWIKTLLERKIFCTTLIPTLNFTYSFLRILLFSCCCCHVSYLSCHYF